MNRAFAEHSAGLALHALLLLCSALAASALLLLCLQLPGQARPLQVQP